MLQVQRFIHVAALVFGGLAACGEDTTVPEEDTRTDADDASDADFPCINDFPCFAELKGCSEDGAALIFYENHTDPMCIGATCIVVDRRTCEEGTRCVLEWVDGAPDGSCRPIAELCGGPTQKTCGENEFCDIRGTYAYTSRRPCQRLQDGHFGVCRPELECADETFGSEVCGCHTDPEGQVVYTNYPNDCARRAAGSRSLCPVP